MTLKTKIRALFPAYYARSVCSISHAEEFVDRIYRRTVVRRPTIRQPPLMVVSSILHSLSAYQPSPTVIAYGISTLLASLAFITFFLGSSAPRKGSIRTLGGIPVLTAWTFFTKRYDFIWSNFQKNPSPHFKFNVLHHKVVALRGEEGRQMFYDSKDLNFTEGYRILFGASPSLKDIKMKGRDDESTAWFNKQIAALFTNKRRLTDNIPALFDDMDRRMKIWGTEGRIDPFKDIYDLVFQMTVRMASCAELSNNLDDIKRIQDLYWTLEKSATPTALLLPWFPGRAKKAKEVATRELYMLLKHYVELRKEAKVPTTDTIDVLLAQGNSTTDVIQFILGVVFAGVINTGIQSCWALLFLWKHPEWRAKVRKEAEEMIEKHTNTTSDEPLHKRLSSIPATVWEDEMPMLELVIRETIRLIFTSTMLRRNIEENITVSGGVINPGDFIAYSVSDVHRNAEIYTSPDEFDPNRYLPGREEDKRSTHAFLGWGAGRHPCTGMKIAKLEIKMIVAMMLVAYDFDVVDAAGRPPKDLPQHDRNDIHQARPLGERVFLQFKRVVE